MSVAPIRLRSPIDGTMGSSIATLQRRRQYKEWSCSCEICTCIRPIQDETEAVRYQQICPVSLASEVIAERWTPLILREIVLFDRRHFNEIQHAVGRISQSLLSARLRTLEEAG